MKLTLAAFFLVLTGCHGKDDCTRVVDHVFELSLAQAGSAMSGADAKSVIADIKAQTIAECRKEGVSAQVADCVLNASGSAWEDQVRACPAYQATPLPWLGIADPAAPPDVAPGSDAPAPATGSATPPSL